MRTSILSRAWNRELKAFTQTFEGDALDASTLMMPIVGFIRGDDPRMLSTIDAIEKKLTDPHGLVYRYKTPDGLEGGKERFSHARSGLPMPWPWQEMLSVHERCSTERLLS